MKLAGKLHRHVAHGAIHWLIGRVVVANHRAEGYEPDAAVELLLGHAARHHHVVVAPLLAVAGHHGEQAWQDAGTAQVGPHRQQAHLAQARAFGLGQVIFQAAEFLVQGEGPPVADANHAKQFPVAPADEVAILGVEAVHQGVVVVGRMLGHLFDEGGVVELENLVEFPSLGSGLEHQAGAVGAVAVNRPIRQGAHIARPLITGQGAGGRDILRGFRHQQLDVHRQLRVARKLQRPALLHYTNRTGPAILNLTGGFTIICQRAHNWTGAL